MIIPTLRGCGSVFVVTVLLLLLLLLRVPHPVITTEEFFPATVICIGLFIVCGTIFHGGEFRSTHGLNTEGNMVIVCIIHRCFCHSWAITS